MAKKVIAQEEQEPVAAVEPAVEIEPSQIETLPEVEADSAPPVDAPTAAPVLTGNQQFTLNDVMALLAQLQEKQAQQNRDTIVQVVQELKKPTPEELEKREAEQRKKMKLHEMRVNEARIAEEAKHQAQELCRRRGHIKKDGSPAWGGQVNSDGYVRPICSQCLKVMPEIKAPIEWITSGVNFQDKEVFPKLTEDMLLQWHKALGPKPKPIKPAPPPFVDKPEVQSITTRVNPM